MRLQSHTGAVKLFFCGDAHNHAGYYLYLEFVQINATAHAVIFYLPFLIVA